MNVTVEDKGACRKVLHIEVPEDVVGTEYTAVARAYASRARIPGFRKGKAPVDIIERKYRAEIEQDLRDRLVPRFYHEALESQQIKPLAIVSIDDSRVSKGSALQFNVTVDVAPEFTLPEYKGIRLTRSKSDIEDAEVDRAIEARRDRLSVFEDADEGQSAESGDIVQVSFTGSCEGTPVRELVAEPATLGDAEEIWMRIGGQEGVPGLSEQLAGAGAGEERSVTVEFPQDYHLEALAGRTAIYEVNVIALRKVKPPTDEELFEEMGVSTLDEARAQARGQIGDAQSHYENERLKRQLVQQLCDQIEVDVPDSMVAMEQRNIIQDYVTRTLKQGVAEGDIAERKEEIAEAAATSSKARVKNTFVLQRIADAEDIDVSDAEVDERVEDMARQYGTSAERVRSELEKNDGLDDLRRDIRYDKTMKFLLDHAEIAEA